MPEALNYRVGPHTGCSFKWLRHQTTEKDPGQGSPLSAWMGRAIEKDWPKKPSDCQLQEPRKKDSDRAITPAGRQSMSLHTWHCQGPCKPSSCATFTLDPHWGRAATGKKRLASMHARSLWSGTTLCNPVACGLSGFSVRGFSRQEYWSVLANTGCIPL